MYQPMFLISATVFDDRTILVWSIVLDDYVSPIQHIGHASAKAWQDILGSIGPMDQVRLAVTDRR